MGMPDEEPLFDPCFGRGEECDRMPVASIVQTTYLLFYSVNARVAFRAVTGQITCDLALGYGQVQQRKISRAVM